VIIATWPPHELYSVVEPGQPLGWRSPMVSWSAVEKYLGGSALLTDCEKSEICERSPSPPKPKQGRPTRKMEIVAAFNALTDEEIDFAEPMNAVYPIIRRKITGSHQPSKGLGDEAIRTRVTHLFGARKTALKTIK
jgi:hypothetical protein